MSSAIKVGLLLSYDYQYLKYALSCVYKEAEQITLAVDKDYRTWTGNNYTIDPLFFEWLTAFDKDKKISIYRDDFYIPELLPMENETRQRTMLGNFMGEGGWHIQIDADEYFVNFSEFVRFLHSQSKYLNNPSKTPVTIIANWVILFKQTSKGFLYVNDHNDIVHIATNYPRYETARNINYPHLYTNFFVFHQTWARSEEEIYLKLKNWGHKNDFDTDAYFKFWKAVDEHNYQEVKDFHPLSATLWKALSYTEGTNVQDFMRNYQQQNTLSVPTWKLWSKNNLKVEKKYSRFMRLANKIKTLGTR